MKFDENFPIDQFSVYGYNSPIKLDLKGNDGSSLRFVQVYIPAKFVGLINSLQKLSMWNLSFGNRNQRRIQNLVIHLR